MLGVGEVHISGRRIGIAIVHEEDLITGLSVSLGGEPNLKPLLSFLRGRGITPNLERKESRFLKLIGDLLLGRIENRELFPLLDTSFLTPFERRLYSLVIEIPRGSVVSYGELAKLLKTSPRAVGSGLKRNPYPLIVPCHRVVAKKGIGGFSGGVKLKRLLLELEGVKKWPDSKPT